MVKLVLFFVLIALKVATLNAIPQYLEPNLNQYEEESYTTQPNEAFPTEPAKNQEVFMEAVPDANQDETTETATEENQVETSETTPFEIQEEIFDAGNPYETLETTTESHDDDFETEFDEVNEPALVNSTNTENFIHNTTNSDRNYTSYEDIGSGNFSRFNETKLFGSSKHKASTNTTDKYWPFSETEELGNNMHNASINATGKYWPFNETIELGNNMHNASINATHKYWPFNETIEFGNNVHNASTNTTDKYWPFNETENGSNIYNISTNTTNQYWPFNESKVSISNETFAYPMTKPPFMSINSVITIFKNFFQRFRE